MDEKTQKDIAYALMTAKAFNYSHTAHASLAEKYTALRKDGHSPIGAAILVAENKNWGLSSEEIEWRFNDLASKLDEQS